MVKVAMLGPANERAGLEESQDFPGALSPTKKTKGKQHVSVSHNSCRQVCLGIRSLNLMFCQRVLPNVTIGWNQQTQNKHHLTVETMLLWDGLGDPFLGVRDGLPVYRIFFVLVIFSMDPKDPVSANHFPKIWPLWKKSNKYPWLSSWHPTPPYRVDRTLPAVQWPCRNSAS